MFKKDLSKKSIAMIIAIKDFRDEEYFIPKRIFQESGIKIKTFSSSLGSALGKMGGEAKINALIKDLNPEDFDAILFIGGSGSVNYVGDEDCERIIQESENMGKVIGAICIAPLVLANAGILNNRKATVWSSDMDKTAIKEIQEQGAIYENKNVVIDGKIITAFGPEAAQGFAQEIIKLI